MSIVKKYPSNADINLYNDRETECPIGLKEVYNGELWLNTSINDIYNLNLRGNEINHLVEMIGSVNKWS